MSAETDFRALLAAHAPLVALADARIAQDAVPEGASYPLVVFSCTHEPLLNLLGQQLADRCTFVVQSWSQTGAAQASALADAVAGAVATAPTARSAAVTSRAGVTDPELGDYGVETIVDWWA